MNKETINVKKLARMGQRGTFGIAMLEKAGKNPNLIVMTADVSIPSGLDRYRKKYENQFIDMGIAEQNMIGVAAGLSSEGFDVYTTTYAPFQTLRCLEQIRMDIGEMKHNVRMVGLSSGVVLGMIGNMHCSFEDMALLRSIANISIISPADSFELLKTLEALDSYEEPVYLRLTGGAPSPVIYKEDYEFKIGKAVTIREGIEVAIVATGTILGEAVKAAELLESKGISVEVINMHTIRPLDYNKVEELCATKKLIVTVEEHVKVGGLGSAVAEASAAMLARPPHLILGLPSDYSKAGIYEDMLDYYGLTANKITTAIEQIIQDLSI